MKPFRENPRKTTYTVSPFSSGMVARN